MKFDEFGSPGNGGGKRPVIIKPNPGHFGYVKLGSIYELTLSIQNTTAKAIRFRVGLLRPWLSLPNFFPFDFCANAPKTHTRAHTAHTHPPQFNPKLNGSLRALRRTHPRNEFQTRQFPAQSTQVSATYSG